jgi:hypothetical protein
MRRGIPKTGGSNTKGTENIITNGSKIVVGEDQFLIVVVNETNSEFEPSLTIVLDALELAIVASAAPSICNLAVSIAVASTVLPLLSVPDALSLNVIDHASLIVGCAVILIFIDLSVSTSPKEEKVTYL